MFGWIFTPKWALFYWNTNRHYTENESFFHFPVKSPWPPITGWSVEQLQDLTSWWHYWQSLISCIRGDFSELCTAVRTTLVITLLGWISPLGKKKTGRSRFLLHVVFHLPSAVHVKGNTGNLVLHFHKVQTQIEIINGQHWTAEAEISFDTQARSSFKLQNTESYISHDSIRVCEIKVIFLDFKKLTHNHRYIIHQFLEVE